MGNGSRRSVGNSHWVCDSAQSEQALTSCLTLEGRFHPPLFFLLTSSFSGYIGVQGFFHKLMISMAIFYIFYPHLCVLISHFPGFA